MKIKQNSMESNDKLKEEIKLIVDDIYKPLEGLGLEVSTEKQMQCRSLYKLKTNYSDDTYDNWIVKMKGQVNDILIKNSK